MCISIHALLTEGDIVWSSTSASWSGFQSTPSSRRATGFGLSYPLPHPISIHALLTEGDLLTSVAGLPELEISIHALLTEGDPASLQNGSVGKMISIHALLTEGDYSFFWQKPRIIKFQSTPSSRRATNICYHTFSICLISIHALLTEGDLEQKNASHQQHEFQSTPSSRRATIFTRPVTGLWPISIHALLTEGDNLPTALRGGNLRFQSTPSSRRATSLTNLNMIGIIDFNPRPPHGGRRHNRNISASTTRFQSTPSSRRATTGRRRCCRTGGISIHALLTEGDTFIMPKIGKPFHFNPRPPHGGRHEQYYSYIPANRISIHALLTEGDQSD